MSHLWLVPLCLLFLAAFINAEHREKWLLGVILKGMASVCFVILGILGSRGAADARFAGLVVAGLATGAAADVLLNLRYLHKRYGNLFFAGGTLVFLVGHLLYSIAVWPRAAMPLLCVAIGAAATVFIMRWIFSQIEAASALKAVGVFYVGMVVILNCLALSALIAHPGSQQAAFLGGTLLFCASDIILILNTFGGEPRFERRILNLVLYYVGQLLIALSLQLG